MSSVRAAYCWRNVNWAHEQTTGKCRLGSARPLRGVWLRDADVS